MERVIDIYPIFKKIVVQLRDLTTNENKKVNKYYNRVTVRTNAIAKTEDYENLVERLDTDMIHCARSEKNDWLYSTFLSEMDRIAIEGKPSIRLDLTLEEFRDLVIWIVQHTEYVGRYIKIPTIPKCSVCDNQKMKLKQVPSNNRLGYKLEIEIV
jgi:hypothetical protein